MCNVSKQAGKNYCALFAAAYCTSIAHGLDLCSLVYDQQQMRDRSLYCLANKKTKSLSIATVDVQMMAKE